MNPLENYYKLQCARLDEERKSLLNQLRLLDEEIANISPTQPPPQQQQQATTQPVVVKKGKQQKAKPQTGSYGQQNKEGPIPFMGLAATPQTDIARKTVLSQYFDNPETENVEVPNEVSWQNINQSVGNYMADKVRQLMKQQGMA